jgi:hypothetical protein
MKLRAEGIAADNGLNAAKRGESRESNPYDKTSFLHKWWDLGWLEVEDNVLQKNQQIKIYSTENTIIDTGTNTVCNIVKRENTKYGRTVLNGIKYTVKQLPNENEWVARVSLDIITRIKNIKGIE